MPLTEKSATVKDERTASNGPLLQHRHFAFIAATIAEISDAGLRYEMAEHFCKACEDTNPAFDKARFLRACKASLLRVATRR